ncbi:MAG: hypothetical protein AAF191_20855 [Verrucomicrobiota bacterium]
MMDPNDVGVEYGPSLVGWGATQTREVIFRSLIDPSADIAHGYQGTELLLKGAGKEVIHGMMLSDGDPKIIRSMGGLTQMVPPQRIAKKSKMNRSLMMSAAQLGLTTEELVDLVAFLKEYK